MTNKQTMKLYTERQMKEMFRMGLAHSINEDGALGQFAPIELPSDEEIEEEALKREYFELSFFNGAKMVISKIQGGNNEQ
jgi:hypothetical protein